MDCLAFHPNCNYVGTGSSDRSLRLWDCVTGNCVRLMTGHKSTVLVISTVTRHFLVFIVSTGHEHTVLSDDIRGLFYLIG